MESCSCVGGCGVTVYILVSLALLEWCVFTIGKAGSEGMDRRTVWNASAASVAILIWLNIPFIFLSYSNNRRRVCGWLVVLEVTLCGPVMLVLSLLGSYWQAIHYEGPSGAFLTDLHWTILFFVSLMTSTIFALFVYIKVWGKQNEGLSSLLPIDYGEVKVTDGSACAVCLQAFKLGEEIGTIKKCRHAYHKDCIESWLYVRNRCPLCRAVV